MKNTFLLLGMTLFSSFQAMAMDIHCKPSQRNRRFSDLLLTAQTEGEFGPITQVSAVKFLQGSKGVLQIQKNQLVQTWTQGNRFDVYCKDLQTDKELLLFKSQHVTESNEVTLQIKGNTFSKALGIGWTPVICESESGQ